MIERTPIGRTKVAVLGTGVMGAPIARNLLRAGNDVTVWNRTRQKAEALVESGAHLAATPAEAAWDAEFLITMLTDGAAVESVMTGSSGALDMLAPGSVWIQMSTVGVPATRHLAGLAEQRTDFIDAPVSGSSRPAELGELLILASGDRKLCPRVRRLFDALGRRTLWLESAGDGSRFKVVLSNWLAVLVEGMAETVSLATALGLEPELLLQTLRESPLGSTYANDKGRAMAEHDFTPGFALHHADKDAGLALEAADSQGLDLPLTRALMKRWDDAIAAGHGNDDVAAAVGISHQAV